MLPTASRIRVVLWWDSFIGYRKSIYQATYGIFMADINKIPAKGNHRKRARDARTHIAQNVWTKPKLEKNHAVSRMPTQQTIH